jgi:amidohydrolase
MELKEKLHSLVDKYINEVTAIRRHLHENPELSFHEFETSKFIQEKLTEYKIPFKAGFVKTGILATIKGKNPEKKTIALRGDMDALPIQENNNLDFKSKNDGVMHACGHDVHTSSVLGVALILKELENDFEGTVQIIFQPGEERLPGGAKLMLEEGLFNEQEPEIIIGQHVQPNIEAGKVGFRPGMYMASADEIYVTVKGKGGHAAMPHQVVDPILITSHIIVALQQLVSRSANVTVPTVLSFGKINGDGATNIIPSEVKVEGTFRTMDEEWRNEAHKKMVKMAESIAEGMGGSCDFEIKKGYPFLVNDDATTTQASKFAKEFLGDENVLDLDLRMTAEDFAYFSQKYPSTFYRLGVQGKDNTNPSPLHSPTFLVDEDALKTSLGTMAWIALKFLNPHFE